MRELGTPPGRCGAFGSDGDEPPCGRPDPWNQPIKPEQQVRTAGPRVTGQLLPRPLGPPATIAASDGREGVEGWSHDLQ